MRRVPELHAIVKVNEVRSITVVEGYSDQYTRAAGVWGSKASLYANTLSNFKETRIAIFNKHTFTTGFLDHAICMKV
jgi:hypothetical protein